MKIEITLTDDKIYVSYGTADICVYKKDNALLSVLTAIHDKSPITIKDEREKIQDHQYKLDCES